MLAGGDIPDLVECVDLSSVRVHAPSPIFFVCGGKTDPQALKPKSLRDAFMQIAYNKPFDKYKALLAEELNAFFPLGTYKDILLFESDIAQISDLIILFSESYGSAAELGAFSMVDEIAQHLLVVIDDKNYADKSFIALGPLRALENKYGNESVLVLNRVDIGIKDITYISQMKRDIFYTRLTSAFKSRTLSAREHTTFNSRRSGHLIKFAVGLIQHYGALTIDEIDTFFDVIGVDKVLRGRINDLLLCAEFAKWIKRDRIGFIT